MIDTLLSSALNDSRISHEEFTNIITEKKEEFFRTYRRKINNIVKII